jgi:hypothetical protein
MMVVVIQCVKEGGGGLAGEWGNQTFCLIFIIIFSIFFS